MSTYCIKVALEEIDETDYFDLLEDLIKKKFDQVKESDPWIRKNKVARYVIGKGFESELAWSIINDSVN